MNNAINMLSFCMNNTINMQLLVDEFLYHKISQYIVSKLSFVWCIYINVVYSIHALDGLVTGSLFVFVSKLLQTYVQKKNCYEH